MMETAVNQKKYPLMVHLKDQHSLIVVPQRQAEELNSGNQLTSFGLAFPATTPGKGGKGSQSVPTADSSRGESEKQGSVWRDRNRVNGMNEDSEERGPKSTLTKTQQIKMLKNTLVNSMNRIAREKQQKETEGTQCSRLENLQWIETCSITESQSCDFDDAESVVIEMTQEEKDFFNNFTYQTPLTVNPFPEEIHTFELMPIQEIGESKEEESYQEPSNKTAVLRNFFRPKTSQEFKGKQSCLTSHTRSQSNTKNKTPEKYEYFFQNPLHL